jgi:hypothetical protein
MLLTWKPALAPVDTSSSMMHHAAMRSLLYKPTVTPRGGARRSARDFVAYNLTVPAFRATYAAPMPPVDIGALQPRPEMRCRCPILKKPGGVVAKTGL